MKNHVDFMFVLSKGKPETATIFDWFKKFKFKNFVVILSHDDSWEEYADNYGIPDHKIHNAPKSVDTLMKKRQWVVEEFKETWKLMVCDNITKITGVKNPKDLSRKGFSHEISPQELLDQVNLDIALAEKENAILGGYASNGNHFFRQKHYRTVGFVWGKIMYMKGVSDFDWDVSQQCKDDYVLTAQCLEYSGSVLVNNWLYAHAKKNEKVGGDGSYEQRVPGMKKCVKHLMIQYEGMYNVADRPNLVAGTEVRMRFTSHSQVDQWRMARRQAKEYKNKVTKHKGYLRT